MYARKEGEPGIQNHVSNLGPYTRVGSVADREKCAWAGTDYVHYHAHAFEHTCTGTRSSRASISTVSASDSVVTWLPFKGMEPLMRA